MQFVRDVHYLLRLILANKMEWHIAYEYVLTNANERKMTIPNAELITDFVIMCWAFPSKNLVNCYKSAQFLNARENQLQFQLPKMKNISIKF